jgi:phosphoglycolate phosphatase
VSTAPLDPVSGLRAVLFDLDGTLADSEPLIAQAVSESCAVFGYAVEPGQIVERIGPPMPVMLQSLLPLAVDEAQAIYDDYQVRYNRSFVPRTQPLPGAVDLLDALRDRDAALAIVTNKNEVGGTILVDALGWTDRFSVVVGMNTTPHAKPAADPALHALRALGVSAAEAAFVGDSEADMGCAAAAGIRAAIGIASLREREALQAAGATHIVEDLDAVATLLAHAGRPAPR